MQQLVQSTYNENIKIRITSPLWGEPQVTTGSPHKGTLVPEVFPYHDVIALMWTDVEVVVIVSMVKVETVFFHETLRRGFDDID